MSLQKTTVMSSVGNVNTFSDGEDSSTVNNYKFLVVLITNDSYTNEETKIRIRLSKPTMAILTKTNNQAEQLAIAKALEALEMIDIEENSPCTAAIITDTRISLDSIKNVNNHSYLIEEIRERLSKLERSNWTVAFAWVKAHAGILGNELADQLAKTAARVKDKTTSYSRIPLSRLFRELEEESKLKWQQNWEQLKQNNSIQA